MTLIASSRKSVFFLYLTFKTLITWLIYIYDRNNLYLNFGHLDVSSLSHQVCFHIFLSKEIEPELHKSVLYFHFNLLSENVPCIPMRVKTLG